MDHVPQHSLSDYLYSELPATIFVVGQLPAGSLDRSVDSVRVRYLSSLAEAETTAADHRDSGDSEPDVPITLILQLEGDKHLAQQLLGRAALGFPYRVLVHCQQTIKSASEIDQLFFSLGFRRLPLNMKDQGDTLCWFEYRLSQYKSAPDWLNARFWANPERFDVDEDIDEYHEQGGDDEE